MPESKKRKRAAMTPRPAGQARKKGPSPRWLPPLMLVMFAVGILWLVVYYISEADLPVASLGDGNLLVGFGFIIVGFMLSTQWR